MKIFRNIRSLPEVYVPLLAVTLILTMLLQIANSVIISCDNALRAMEENYPVTVEVAPKEILARDKLSENSSSATSVNVNTAVIGSALLNTLREVPGVESLEYYSKPYRISTEQVLSVSTYEEISEKVKNGEPFEHAAFGFDWGDLYTQYTKLVCVTSVNQIYQSMDLEADVLSVTLHDENRGLDGAILPKSLYDTLGQPREIIVGWSEGTVGLNITSVAPGEAYEIPMMQKSTAANRVNMPKEPAQRITVAGYYELDENFYWRDLSQYNNVFCPPETWALWYKAEDYYQQSDFITPKGRIYHTRHYYLRENVNPYDEVTLQKVTLQLTSPTMVAKVMDAFHSAVEDSSLYEMIAYDYDYKFAATQIESVRSMAETLMIVLTVFSGVIMLLVIFYSVKRRRNEVYTLRTLGEKNHRIIFGITGEFFAVMLGGVGGGMLLSLLFGNAICTVIGNAAGTRAAAVGTGVSDSLAFMDNKEALQAQMQGALDRYLAFDFRITYEVSALLGILTIAAVVLLGLYVGILITNYTRKSLMHKEEF